MLGNLQQLFNQLAANPQAITELAHWGPHLIMELHKQYEEWSIHSNERDRAPLDNFFKNYQYPTSFSVQHGFAGGSGVSLPVNDKNKQLEEIQKMVASLDNGPLKDTLLNILSQNKA